jgi:hypothetical protein
MLHWPESFFIKAIIAKEHPLLIFRDLFHLENSEGDELEIEQIIEKGKTYNFENLPKLLWVTTGERLADQKSFDLIRKVRNSVQHFCVPENESLRQISLDFLYKNIDPLIYKNFGICAIKYHEDDVGYDHVVACLVRHELLFSIPPDFQLPEIDLSEVLATTSKGYQKKFRRLLKENDCSSVLD